MSEIEKYTEKVFEDIKHIDETGTEYWYARELMPLLGYSKWQRFKDVINKAMITCEISNYIVSDHFTGIGKMVEIGSEASRKVEDFKLSRYACYLITQNGDSRKSVIALAQTYFAIQTRKMELTELEYEGLSEEEKRLYRRKQASDGNGRTAAIQGGSRVTCTYQQQTKNRQQPEAASGDSRPLHQRENEKLPGSVRSEQSEADEGVRSEV